MNGDKEVTAILALAKVKKKKNNPATMQKLLPSKTKHFKVFVFIWIKQTLD